MPNNKTLIRYIMEAGNKFNEIINDSISKASEGLSHKIDAYLLSDLKRMSNLGVLEIHQEQPEIMPFDENKNSISISQKIRLYFKGEETIKELKKEIEELKQGLSIRDMHDQANSKFPMPSQTGKKSAFIEGAKWYRETLKEIKL